MRSILIKQNSEIEMIYTSTKMSLKELQEKVDGYIEWITINPENSTGYYVNEEGKFNKKMNELATKWWYWNLLKEVETLKGVDDYISGDVIFIKMDDEGEQCSLNDEDINEFEGFVLAYNIMMQKDEYK